MAHGIKFNAAVLFNLSSAIRKLFIFQTSDLHLAMSSKTCISVFLKACPLSLQLTSLDDITTVGIQISLQ